MNMKTQFIALSLCLLAFCYLTEAKVSSRKSNNFIVNGSICVVIIKGRSGYLMTIVDGNRADYLILSAYLILYRKIFIQAMVGIVNL